MRICRPSAASDVPRLKALWKRCFADENRYIDHFFRNGYVPEQTLVLEEGGEVVSMLTAFPATIHIGADSQPACYIYAFCTHPDHQGKGCGRQLLSWAEQWAAQRSCAAVLMVPGEESLFRFYAGLGYTTTLTHRDVVWGRSELPITDPKLTPIDALEYGGERAKWLSGWNRIDLAPEGLAFQRELCRFTGAGFYRVADGIAAVEFWDGSAEIKELLCSDFKAGAAAVCQGLGAQQVHLYLPGMLQEGEERPFAVLKSLGTGMEVPADCYFAFAFD